MHSEVLVYTVRAHFNTVFTYNALSGHTGANGQVFCTPRAHRIYFRNKMKQGNFGARFAQVQCSKRRERAPAVHYAHMVCVRRDQFAKFVHTLRGQSTLCRPTCVRVENISHVLHTRHFINTM